MCSLKIHSTYCICVFTVCTCVCMKSYWYVIMSCIYLSFVYMCIVYVNYSSCVFFPRAILQARIHKKRSSNIGFSGVSEAVFKMRPMSAMMNKKMKSNVVFDSRRPACRVNSFCCDRCNSQSSDLTEPAMNTIGPWK